jgi:hypothetical protein
MIQYQGVIRFLHDSLFHELLKANEEDLESENTTA